MAQSQGLAPRPPGLPLKAGKVDFADTTGVKLMLQLLGSAELPPVEKAATEPFVGITTDGRPRPELFPLNDEGVDPGPAVSAAEHYLRFLQPAELARATCAIDGPEWQLWLNAFVTFPEHGLRLEDLSRVQREAAMGVIESTLSSAGYQQMRNAMKLNLELGEFIDQYRDTLTEWCYWFTIFGEPSESEPWGWQLQGHHVDLHCFILGRQRVLTPAFLGVEFQGDRLFSENRRVALELINSLTPEQLKQAVLYDSMEPGALPDELSGIVDGRHRAGAGRDNRVLPYEGIAGEALTDDQRELMRRVFEPYLANVPDGHAGYRREIIARHLDECWFCWIGGRSNEEPFYYKLHSPVILVEYDNHAGIFLNNDTPEPYHVHTIVRTPNGGDYGKSLLAKYYALQDDLTSTARSK